MPDIIPSISETIVTRLLREYFNEIGYAMNLAYEDDMTIPELQQHLILLDAVYAQKIVKALS